MKQEVDNSQSSECAPKCLLGGSLARENNGSLGLGDKLVSFLLLFSSFAKPQISRLNHICSLSQWLYTPTHNKHTKKLKYHPFLCFEITKKLSTVFSVVSNLFYLNMRVKIRLLYFNQQNWLQIKLRLFNKDSGLLSHQNRQELESMGVKDT